MLRPITLFLGIYMISGCAISVATGSFVEGFGTALITSILKSVYAHYHHIVWDKASQAKKETKIHRCTKCDILEEICQ